MNNDVSKFKEHNLEREKEVNELNGELDFFKMENENIEADLEKELKNRDGLLENIIRFEFCR